MSPSGSLGSFGSPGSFGGVCGLVWLVAGSMQRLLWRSCNRGLFLACC